MIDNEPFLTHKQFNNAIDYNVIVWPQDCPNKGLSITLIGVMIDVFIKQFRSRPLNLFIPKEVWDENKEGYPTICGFRPIESEELGGIYLSYYLNEAQAWLPGESKHLVVMSDEENFLLGAFE